MRVLLLQPDYGDSKGIEKFVLEAVQGLEKESVVNTIKNLQNSYEVEAETIKSLIERSDLVIGNMDGGNISVTFGLGIAASLEKPILLLTPSDRALVIPRQLLSYRLFAFSLNDISSFVEGLKNQIEFSINPLKIEEGIKNRHLFISYCHKDVEFLNRLIIHLKPLERAGSIESWADTRLKTGDLWKTEVEKALSRSRAAVLLLSADFMASDFITNNELPPLLAKAETQGTKIFPLIIKPCRFLRDTNLSKFQAANDPTKPLISLSEGEKEKIYDNLATEIDIFLNH